MHALAPKLLSITLAHSEIYRVGCRSADAVMHMPDAMPQKIQEFEDELLSIIRAAHPIFQSDRISQVPKQYLSIQLVREEQYNAIQHVDLCS